MSQSLRLFSPENPPDPTPRRGRRLPDFLRENELAALFATAEAVWRDTPAKQPKWKLARQRDYLMILTGYYCGLRVAELCGLNVEDIDLAGGLLIVRHGKGDADGSVPLNNKVKAALADWISGRGSGVLFRDPRGRHVCTRHFRTRLKLLARKAGISRRVHPHILRHSFATHLLRKGLNAGVTIYDVQKLLRHADIKNSAVYLHLLPGKLGEAVELL